MSQRERPISGPTFNIAWLPGGAASRLMTGRALLPCVMPPVALPSRTPVTPGPSAIRTDSRKALATFCPGDRWRLEWT